MGDRPAPNDQVVDPSDAGSSGESGAIVRVANVGSVPSNEGRMLNEETHRVVVIPEMFRRSSVVMRSPPKLDAVHISVDPVPHVESEPHGWSQFRAALADLEKLVVENVEQIRARRTTAVQTKDQADSMRLALYKVNLLIPESPVHEPRPCTCERLAHNEVATQTETVNDRANDIRRLLTEANTIEERVQLCKGEWPEEAFVSTRVDGLDSAVRAADVTLLILPLKGNGNNVKTLCARTAGLQRILEEEDLRHGACAVLRGSLNVTIDGVEERQSDQQSTVTIVTRPDEAIADGYESVMSALAKAITRIDEASKRICVVTACGMYRTRKVLESLLVASDRTAVVVEAAENSPGKARRVVSHPASSSVVTVQGPGQTYAELVKAVKSTVNIEQEGIEVLAMRRRDDDALTIRLKGNEGKATAFLKAVNKAAGLTASMRRQMDAIDVRDLELDTTKADIIASLRKEVPEAAIEDFSVTSVRASYSGTNRATVMVASRWAAQILERRSVRIGWVSCRVRRKDVPTHCFKCWAGDHMASSCRGPDRRQACFKCGKPGHLMAKCTENKWCPICETDAHSFADQTCTKKKTATIKHGPKVPTAQRRPQ